MSFHSDNIHGYRDSVDNTVEENSSIFPQIRICWLQSEQ